MDEEELRYRALTATDRNVLFAARQNGWIAPEGDVMSVCRQAESWALYCRENKLDYLEFDGESSLVVRPVQRLSRMGYDAVRRFAKSKGLEWHDGLEGPLAGNLGEICQELGLLFADDRSPERALELQRQGRLQEGMAAILDPAGLWPDVGPKDLVYVREIVGRPGRCLALWHLHPPLVDVPLEQFRVLHEEET
jgi:hypothetical protein